MSSEVFKCLQELLDMFMLSSKSLHSRDKILTPITKKTLAGILDQVIDC